MIRITSRSSQQGGEDHHNQTDIQDRDNLTSLMEKIAREEDRQAFISLMETLDWSGRQPDEMTMAIDLALQMEMTTLAIELAELGANLFPHHERIQRAAQVLAPPVARQTYSPPSQDLEASRQWLRENASDYRGQWVAVSAGKLLSTGASLDEARANINEDEDTINVLITRVL